MEKRIENETETGVMRGVRYRVQHTQIVPTLGPTVCKYYLHWAIWIPRVIIGMHRGSGLK